MRDRVGKRTRLREVLGDKRREADGAAGDGTASPDEAPAAETVNV
jgi:hypothetical protein